MTRDVYLIGTAQTAFRKGVAASFAGLCAEAVTSALEDGGGLHPALDAGLELAVAAFGNCGLHVFGQSNIRGQACLAPLKLDGALPSELPIVNVEGGCATGALAFHHAVQAIRAGAQMALCVGVEKTSRDDDPRATAEIFHGGANRLDEASWRAHITAEAQRSGLSFAPQPERFVFVDVHALLARHHMKRYGSTVEQFAFSGAKNHGHGALNPDARVRVSMTPEAVLDDVKVVFPLTRSMCSPLSDAAAAAWLVSGDVLPRLAPQVRERAVRVRACALAGGSFRGLDDPSVSHRAAQRAYAEAGLGPEQIDVAELHDATSPCEVLHCEALGFCAEGEGGSYVASGATTQQGERPINLSGGLVSKGHPLAATGLGMVHEIALQLRGEAGERQAPGAPTVGLCHNAGGLEALDEALAAVTVLERT